MNRTCRNHRGARGCVFRVFTCRCMHTHTQFSTSERRPERGIQEREDVKEAQPRDFLLSSGNSRPTPSAGGPGRPGIAGGRDGPTPGPAACAQIGAGTDGLVHRLPAVACVQPGAGSWFPGTRWLCSLSLCPYPSCRSGGPLQHPPQGAGGTPFSRLLHCVVLAPKWGMRPDSNHF